MLFYYKRIILNKLPKISFGIIVLNGEPFTRYCLRALYPYAHQIIVVEGAVRGAAAIATEDGHSSDNTLHVLQKFKSEEDPDNKVLIITTDGFWSEKDDMSRAYLSHATGDYLWHVDIDEFYLPKDIEYILSMLSAEPDIGTVSFMHYAFWGSPHYQVGSTYLMRGAGETPRIFRISTGYTILTHRPMTVLDDNNIDVRHRKWIRGKQLETLGIQMYHYTLLFPKQVRDKISYYSTWSLERCKHLKEWMNNNYFGLTDPFNLFTVNDYPGWLEPYDGLHPPQITAMWKDIQDGRIDAELHPLKGIPELVNNPKYRRKITLLKEQVFANPEEPLDLKAPFVRKEILETDKGLRVLFLNERDSEGGAAQIAYSVASHLQLRDGRPTMVVGKRNRSKYWIIDPPARALDKALEKSANEAGMLDYGIISSFYLLDRLEFRQADVVNLHNQHRGYLNPLAIALLGRQKPLVWTLHDMQALTGHCAHALECSRYITGCGECPKLDTYPAITHDTTAQLWKDKYDAAKLFNPYIIVPSQWMRQRVEESLLAQHPIKVIPNGIDISIFHPIPKHQARQRLGLPLDRQILAFTAHGGLQNPWKGGRVLINALKFLTSKHPKILLLNIGGDYAHSDLPMASIPYVTDPNTLATIYSASDVFAYPTLADSFGLVALEARACGLPVVSFATGGVPEIVQDGVNGLLVPQNDQERFNIALDMLLKKDLLRQAMSQAAAQIPESFTVQKMTDTYSTIYIQAKETFERQGPPLADRTIVMRLSQQLASLGNRVGAKAYRSILMNSNT